MGRGCNRRTLKMRARKAWSRNKARLRKKIEVAKAAAKGGLKAAN